jgi:hypothetical protein
LVADPAEIERMIGDVIALADTPTVFAHHQPI